MFVCSCVCVVCVEDDDDGNEKGEKREIGDGEEGYTTNTLLLQ